MRYRSIILLLVLLSVLTAPVVAATVQVHANGTAIFTVPASQYVNVFGSGAASTFVYKKVGYPNLPSQWVLETNGDVANEEVSFGPYTNATEIKVEAGVDPAFYSVGSGGLAIPVARVMPALSASAGSVFRIGARLGYPQLAPATQTTTATLTAANLLTGIITGTHSAGSTATYTLPTGTLLEAAVPYLQIGEAFEWTLINLSAAAVDTITLAAGTDHTIVGTAVVPSAHSTTGGLYGNAVTWITRKTAANTFVTYRKN